MSYDKCNVIYLSNTLLIHVQCMCVFTVIIGGGEWSLLELDKNIELGLMGSVSGRTVLP